MRVELVTIWYNEEFLAPFFLNHYSWVDKIHLVIDSDTNDATVSIAQQYPNVEIGYINFPDMMDDKIKADKFNTVYRSIVDADYVIVVDSDEFIFCNLIEKPVKTHIEDTLMDVYFVHLWQIYKHEFDAPLDPNIPTFLQRRHGDPDMGNGSNLVYIKPCVVKVGKNIFFGIGNHCLDYDGVYVSICNTDVSSLSEKNVSVNGNDMLQGSHWRLVDVEESIKRRIINRKWRQSKTNLENGYCSNYHHITKKDILKEYEDNKQNPIVIYSRIFD